MSDRDEDIYADDDYEEESPARPQQVPSPVQTPQPERQNLQFESDDQEDEESESGAVTPLSKTKPKRSVGRRDPTVPSGRYLMDNTPWIYTVRAAKVRMLRIPVAESAAIQELRVFATVDKHAAQSRGSRWKQELQVSGGPLTSGKGRKKSKSHATTGRTMESNRRSGLIEEAKWRGGDGKLQWMFPMEKFRRLKAYAPRIKAYVYGIGEMAGDRQSRPRMENLARHEKDGKISSFGWFFLDLRTPDLPERWIKLQNSPFGGEILISTTFSPVEMSTSDVAAPTDLSSRKEERGPVTRRTETRSNAPSKVAPIVISGEGGEYLRIGESGGNDIFVISVFIQSALNLTSVVEAAMGRNREEPQRTGFWLSYSLFDVVVQTDVFYNLDVAEFPPIRDSFRVQANLKDLGLCIETLGSITVFMCTENKVLAGVEIPLRPLLTEGLFSVFTAESNAELKPGEISTTEGSYSFPDFADAVIVTSVEIEFIQSEKPTATDARGIVGPEVEHVDIQADELSERANSPVHTWLFFNLDHVRLLNSSLTPFEGEEKVIMELRIGDNKVSEGITFSAFTKDQAFATSTDIEVALPDIADQEIVDNSIRIHCYSSRSSTTIATSKETTAIIGSETSLSKIIMLLMVNESKEVIGECALRCRSESSPHEKSPARDASIDKRRYRMCLRLESVRDIELPLGEYSLRYQNPFFGSGSIRSDLFDVQQIGEIKTLDFYCTFDVAKEPAQLKEEMQASVNIDLISGDGKRVGSSIFSLSYLFFSEERYCCSEETCEDTFRTEAETEAHWFEVHGETTLPETDVGPEAYTHSYRSCSINIPVVSADADNNQSKQASRRVGSIHVSAYLEDLGVLTKKQALLKEFMILLPPQAWQDKESTHLETRAHTTSISPHQAADTKARDRSSSTSVVRETEETSRYSALTGVSFMPDNFADKVQRNANEMLKAQVHEREKHAAALFESLEKERSAWKQEQHLQQLQWKRRFAEMEKARMDELEEEWARREEERSALLRSAQEEYQRLEQTLRKSLADLEMRERRLAVAEAALQREQEAKRDETEYLHRRLKSEQAHTLSLTKKQTEAYERRVSLLETQLADAENRAKQVEADFAEYRQQQRKVPESKLREEIAALKGNVAELEKQKMVQERACEIAEANVDKMKLQLEQMAAAVKEEKKKHEARVVDELEKLRVKYIAREEKYVLDGDRDELRAIKKQLDDLKGISFRRGGRNSRSNGHHRSRQSVSPQPRQAHTRHHQANLTRRTLSAMQRYNHAASSSSFDQGSDDEIYWEGLSVIGGANEDISVQNNPAAPHDSPGFRTVREAFIVKADLSEPITPPPQYDGPGDSELERLTRERKLLLASGAYDTESYLVQELDRLISITRANIEH